MKSASVLQKTKCHPDVNMTLKLIHEDSENNCKVTIMIQKFALT